jgi:hypothetical protein
MTFPAYEFRRSGRRPLTGSGLVLSILLLGLAIRHDAPLIILVIWGPCAAALLWMFTTNPVSGLRLDDSALTLSPWRAPSVIRLEDIDRLEHTDWSEGSTLEVMLVNGQTVRAFAGDIPPIEQLRAACEARGLELIER